MGAALKKGQDYSSMGRLKWAAWGVIDIETLERMQRRNYINHVREELALRGLQLETGGAKTFPYYRIYEVTSEGKVAWSTTSANVRHGAFAKVCRDTLARIEPETQAPEGINV